MSAKVSAIMTTIWIHLMNWPMTPRVTTMGRKADMMVIVEAMKGAANCFAEATAASLPGRPVSRRRAKCSVITTELSTRLPMQPSGIPLNGLTRARAVPDHSDH